MVELKFFGHACVMLSSGTDCIITDPWFGVPIGFGVLHAFPPMQPPTPKELEKITAVHISHMHADHFCPKSLSLFRRDIPVFIARHRDQVFCKKLQSLGFTNIIEIDPGPKGYQFGSLRLSTFIPNRVFPYDSSLVVTVGEDSYLFDNDARFDQYHYKWLSFFFKKFVGVFVAYTDNYPFPVCYDFSKCKSIAHEISDETLHQSVADQSWKRVEGICEKLKPEWVVPYAGSLRFLNKDMTHLNRTFINANELLKYNTATARPLFFQPGDIVANEPRYEMDRTPTISESDLKPNIRTEIVTYDEVMQVREQIEQIFIQILNKESKQWTQAYSVQVQVVSTDSKIFTFNLRFDGESVALNDQYEPALVIKYDAAVLMKLVSKEWTVRNVHYSYRFSAEIHDIAMGQAAVHSWSL